MEAAATDEEFQAASADFMEAVYHQGDFCAASYAVVPHLARICEAAPMERQGSLLHMIGLIENARRERSERRLAAIEAAEDIVREYHETIRLVPQMIARCARAEWTREVGTNLAAALLYVKGLGALGGAVSDFRSNGIYRALQCRKCGGWLQVPKPGERAEQPAVADRPCEER